MALNIKTQLIPKGSKRRGGARIQKVGFFVDHDTGNPNSTAQNNVDYYCRECNPKYAASAHAFIDDKGVIICIPCMEDDVEKAWHVLYDKPLDNKLYGDDANDIAIGLELCFFPKDKARTLKAYDNYIEFAASLAKEHGVAPGKRSAHSELDPGRKVDPGNALKFIDKTYEDMKKDIVAKYNVTYNSLDADYKKAVDVLVNEGIIGQPMDWIPRLSLKNVDALVKKIGVKMFGVHGYVESVNAMVMNRIISSPNIWIKKMYTEDHVKSLIIKVASIKL